MKCGVLRTTRIAVVAITATVPTYREKQTRADSYSSRTSSTDNLFLKQKALVGAKAVDDFVADGMVVGIGSGSTASFSLKHLAESIKNGRLHDIKVVPCSQTAARFCKDHGVITTSLSDCVEVGNNLDLIIDGADEIGVDMALVKGGHGSLILEKLMENMADRVVIVTDESKLVRNIGARAPIPVEIIPHEAKFIIKQIEQLPSMHKARGMIRKGTAGTHIADGATDALSDNNLLIVDFYLEVPLYDPAAAAADLDGITGVVSHGIFTGQATTIMVATSDPTHPVRIVGDPAPNRPDRTEDPWWADKQISLSRRRSLERERVDNREPATATAGTAGVSGGASAGHSSKHTQ